MFKLIHKAKESVKRFISDFEINHAYAGGIIKVLFWGGLIALGVTLLYSSLVSGTILSVLGAAAAVLVGASLCDYIGEKQLANEAKKESESNAKENDKDKDKEKEKEKEKTAEKGKSATVIKEKSTTAPKTVSAPSKDDGFSRLYYRSIISSGYTFKSKEEAQRIANGLVLSERIFPDISCGKTQKESATALSRLNTSNVVNFVNKGLMVPALVYLVNSEQFVSLLSRYRNRNLSEFIGACNDAFTEHMNFVKTGGRRVASTNSVTQTRAQGITK